MDSTRGTKHMVGHADEVDQASGRVRFGDGVQGERPPSGQRLPVEGRKQTSTDSTCCAPPPFERNHYFLGKLLTADDFQAEQEYHNGKRRLLNRLLYGASVLCGLHVQQATESHLTITAGVAVDGCGREIVVPHDVTIDLLDHLPRRKGATRAGVWLHYAECGVAPVPVMGSKDDEAVDRVHHRIKEGYRIEVRWDYPTRRAPDDRRDSQSQPEQQSRGDADAGVLLARVLTTTTAREVTIRTITGEDRKTVASFKQLQEALQGLQKDLEALQRQRRTCPHCHRAVDV